MFYQFNLPPPFCLLINITFYTEVWSRAFADFHLTLVELNEGFVLYLIFPKLNILKPTNQIRWADPSPLDLKKK